MFLLDVLTTVALFTSVVDTKTQFTDYIPQYKASLVLMRNDLVHDLATTVVIYTHLSPEQQQVFNLHAAVDPLMAGLNRLDDAIIKAGLPPLTVDEIENACNQVEESIKSGKFRY
jgi:hypothetical protein